MERRVGPLVVTGLIVVFFLAWDVWAILVDRRHPAGDTCC
jgi:hypothetical protein